MVDFTIYQSPYSWRYASLEMRQLWSEIHKRQLWRKIWTDLAEVESTFGVVTVEQVNDLKDHVNQVDIQRSLEIEAEIRHDLMAEVKAFAEQCKVGGGIIHLGATSMDIEDNADALRLRDAIAIIIQKLSKLLLAIADKIDHWSEIPAIGYTHLQPAEPTTLGYRFALYAQDLLEDWSAIKNLYEHVKGKGFKGAVGTAASYAELIGIENISKFEELMSHALGIKFYPVTNQIYPRKQDYQIISALAGVGSSLYKFAFDLRFLQTPSIGEMSEPFGKQQVGSSAMPFKKNPIQSEKINSLGRTLAQMPQIAWQNASHSLLERTLDDSANRRSLLPEAFLLTDELVATSIRIITNLQVDQNALQHNLAIYGPFASTERLMMALVSAGADRQEIHELLRQHALIAWESIRRGQSNPLIELITEDPVITSFLTIEQIYELTQISSYFGIAPQRAKEMARTIRETL